MSNQVHSFSSRLLSFLIYKRIEKLFWAKDPFLLGSEKCFSCHFPVLYIEKGVIL